MVITDHANLQYYCETSENWPASQWIHCGVGRLQHSVGIQARGKHEIRPTNCLGDPNMAPEDEDETGYRPPLIICLPPRDSPSKAYVATRTKPENYDSDSGYESEGTDDSRHVNKKFWQTIAETSFKDLAPENTALKARAAKLGRWIHHFGPSSSIRRSRRPKEKTPRPSDNGNGRTVLRN